MKTKLLLFAAILFCLFNYDSFSQILWTKSYQTDSLAFTSFLYTGMLKRIDGKIFLTFMGNKKSNKYSSKPNSGFVVTDLQGNLQGQFEVVKDRYFVIRNIFKNSNGFDIFSEYDFKDTTSSSDWLNVIPHFYKINNELDINQEDFDTSSTILYNKNQIGHYAYDGNEDSIFVLQNFKKQDSIFNYISILNRKNKLIRQIKCDYLYPENKEWISWIFSGFKVINNNNFLILMNKNNGNYFYYESELFLLDNNGKKLWSSCIRYNNKITGINDFIINKDGDFVCFGNTLPNISESILLGEDTSKIQRDSLLLVKIGKDGIIKWMKEYPLPNKTNITAIHTIKDSNTYAFLTSYIDYRYITTEKRWGVIYLFNNDGEITYNYKWRVSDSLNTEPNNIISIGDTLIMNIMAYKGAKNLLYLMALDPNSTSVNETEKLIQNQCVIAPNPATERVSVEFDFDGIDTYSTKIELFNMLGTKIKDVEEHIVFDGTSSKAKIDFSVSGLPAGMYFIKIGNKVQKFVKM